MAESCWNIAMCICAASRQRAKKERSRGFFCVVVAFDKKCKVNFNQCKINKVKTQLFGFLCNIIIHIADGEFSVARPRV